MKIENITIEHLGHRGDGVGAGLYVPFTLPGEAVRVETQGERGRLVEVMSASPHRVAPPCEHFGACGGCALQHLAAGATLEWKRGLVVAALASRGLEASVAPTIACPPYSRRRAVLAARWGGQGIALGFHARLSDALVPVRVCHVVVPRIEAALPALAKLLAMLDRPRLGEASVTVLATEAGLDVSIDGVRAPATAARSSALIAKFAGLDIARLTLGGETVASVAEPRLWFGRASLVPPPGGFVQAVAEAEAAMAALVAEGVGKAKRVADLFAGSGTFALRLAEHARVHAVEGERAAVEAVLKAAKATPGLKQVTAETRDLFRRPLLPPELAGFDAVVLDPPRAGAEAQARALAASRVPRVAAVSCNPATFARDARILVDGGYALERVTPIDQFVFSSHVELVALFTR